jgi:hypothetical protein
VCRARRMFQSFSIWRYTEGKKGPIKMLSAVGRSKSNATDSETGLVMTKRRSFGEGSRSPSSTHISILCPFWQLTQISLFTVTRPWFKFSHTSNAVISSIIFQSWLLKEHTQFEERKRVDKWAKLVRVVYLENHIWVCTSKAFALHLMLKQFWNV